MEWQKLAGSRWTSRITLAAALALAAATACSGSPTFKSTGGSGGTGGAAAGSGGSAAGNGGTGGTSSAGAGGATPDAGGAAGSGTGGGAPTCGTCDGCCVGSSCIPAAQQSWSKCGAHGSICSSCAYGVTCDSGQCTDSLDPAALFHIVVDTVHVQPTDASGNSWDSFGGEPDPQVCFDDGQGTNGCTNYCSDMESCSYSAADGTVASVMAPGTPVNFTGASLSHVTMVVFDYDPPPTSSDNVGSRTLQLQQYATEYSYGSFEQVITVTFHLEPGQ